MLLGNRPNRQIHIDSTRDATDAGYVSEREVTWTHAPIGRFIRGAVRLEHRDDGLVQPRRFSEAQMAVLEVAGRKKRAVATAGVTIDFMTTGDEISFKCLVTRELDKGNPTYHKVMSSVGDIGKAEDGILDGIDIAVDGRVHTLEARTGTIRLAFENPQAIPLEVVVYLPCIMSVAVGELASTGQITPAPQRDYILALGDSITQGFVTGCPSQTWVARVARALSVDMMNQSVAGYVFDADTLSGMFKLRRCPPRAIFVAYGTNDWSRKETSERIETEAAAYLDRLERYFPATPTFVLTPTWRADAADSMPCGKKLKWMGKMLRRQCKGRPGFHVIDGGELLPHDPRFMADGRLHPSSTGAEIIADNVLDEVKSAAPRLVQELTNAGSCLDPTSEVALADAQTLERPGAPGRHPDFDRVVRTIWRLRQSDGCPWDKVQTHVSIKKNMVEEAYEAVDAIEAGDDAHLCEELGDVLMQVLLHAQIAADEGSFDMDDVTRGLDEKLVRRHPHVFGEHERASSADEVAGIWSDVKMTERRQAANGPQADGVPAGLLDSVPRALPSLMQCQKISKKAAACGFEWETTADVWDKVAEERAEFAVEPQGSPEATMEFGDVLFALVNVARKEGIDAEEALRVSCDKFRHRWTAMEAMARADGRDVSDLDHDELEGLWNRAKAGESGGANLV